MVWYKVKEAQYFLDITIPSKWQACLPDADNATLYYKLRKRKRDGGDEGDNGDEGHIGG